MCEIEHRPLSEESKARIALVIATKSAKRMRDERIDKMGCKKGKGKGGKGR
jgi:hypothetical protein